MVARYSPKWPAAMVHDPDGEYIRYKDLQLLPRQWVPFTRKKWPRYLDELVDGNNEIWKVEHAAELVELSQLDEDGRGLIRRLSYEDCFNEFRTPEGRPCGELK